MFQETWLEKEVQSQAETQTARGYASSADQIGSQRAGNQKGRTVKRDPNLDNPAVRLYREVIHLQANYLQREEIAERVGESETCLRLWRATLTEWMLRGNNPKNVLGMLKVYKDTIDGLIGANR
jgi:hypothetical protein